MQQTEKDALIWTVNVPRLLYVCFYFLILEGKSLQIQYKYFNINIVYPAPKGLSTTFSIKQNIKLSNTT